jgi:predicted dehydrogenase
MSKFRAAIVGMGYWGPKIARTIHLNPNFDLVAVCDLNESLAKSQLEKIGITNLPIYRDYRELLAIDLDLVVIAIPPHVHVDVARYFLSNDVNVFVEKPFGLSQAERDVTVRLAMERNLNIYVDHTYLFSQEFAIVKETIDSGEIGLIDFYTSSRVNLGLLQESTNVVEDLMIHDLAILDVLKGMSPIRVSCIGNKTIPSRQFGTAFANLIYSDGFIANLSVSWHSPVKIRQINIVGRKGAITWDDTAGSDKVKIYDSKIEDSLTPEDFRVSYHLGDGRIPRVAGIEPLAKEFQTIYSSLNKVSNVNVVNGAQHILRTGKTLEAITKSLTTNNPVDVN